MPIYSHEPWLEVVNPFPGESISSFLGRFERANVWTTYQIGRVSGLGAVVSRWKKLYLNPFPKREELEALAQVVEVSADRLAQMLPPLGKTMKPRPIKLCGACNLAAYIVEKAMEEAEAEGKIPPPPKKQPPAEKG